MRCFKENVKMELADAEKNVKSTTLGESEQ
jgi:hypothetical protein